MSDASLALILVPAFLAALACSSWFRTLDTRFLRESSIPLLAGFAAGVILHFSESLPGPRAILTGVLLTFVAMYLRLTGRESEPGDGMLIGAATGVAAGAVFATGDAALPRLSECILAGAVAGYGITWGVSQIRDRLRQIAFDAATAAAAVFAAWVPMRVAREGIADRRIAIASAGTILLVAVTAVFRQWPRVRDELQEEASLGFIDPDDVRTTAHPLVRLGRAGWHSSGAHREFVRVATRIALRKRQQRVHTEQVARLYQLEVIKLRMEMQEMTQIDRAMRSGDAREETA